MFLDNMKLGVRFLPEKPEGRFYVAKNRLCVYRSDPEAKPKGFDKLFYRKVRFWERQQILWQQGEEG